MDLLFVIADFPQTYQSWTVANHEVVEVLLIEQALDLIVLLAYFVKLVETNTLVGVDYLEIHWAPHEHPVELVVFLDWIEAFVPL